MAARPGGRRAAKGEYIETDTGNKISRRSKIEGTPHIIFAGRVVVQAEACLRGDLCREPTSGDASTATRAAISVGRYTLVSTGATLHPPHRTGRGGEAAYYAMKVGEHVYVGPGAHVAAASVGSHVHIGRGAVVGNGCVLRDNVKVLDGAVLPAGTVVPTGVVVGGRPARIVGDLPEGWGVGEVGAAAAANGEWVEGGELRELIRSIK